MAGKEKEGINYQEAQVSGLLTAGTNGILQAGVPNARIARLSSGQGNMNAVGRTMQTKIANNTISTMSFNTAAKSAIGLQAADAYRTIISGLIGIVQSLSSIISSKK